MNNKYIKILETYQKEIDPEFDLKYYNKLIANIEDDVFAFWRRIVKTQELRKDRNKLFYLAVVVAIVKWEFHNLNSFFDRIEAPAHYKREFYTRIKQNYPKVSEMLDHYNTRIKEKMSKALYQLVEKWQINEEDVMWILENKFDLAVESATKLLEMKEIIMEAVNDKIPEVAEYYATDIANWIAKSIKELVSEQIEWMKEELVKSRTLILKWTMMASVWYYNWVKKRMKTGDVNYKELETAYKIMKTELWEPMSIKETHQKWLNVVINVPTDIANDWTNTDLNLEIADKFKDVVEAKLADTNRDDIKSLDWEVIQEKEIITNIELDDKTN